MTKSPKRRRSDRHKGKLFTFRLEQSSAERLRIMAAGEMRPCSNMIAVLVEEALKARNGKEDSL
jgi:hypothetical protein